MPLVGQQISINPIDLPENEQVAVGIRFPFNNEGVFFSTYTTKEQVKSNLINLLMTDRGERINELEFGVGVRRLVFEQDIDKESLRIRIEEGIERYIPGIQLQNLQINKPINEHTLTIKLSYKLLSNYDVDAVAINFNM